ncbi:BrnA antitoxin family protein [Arhodomonas sp. SL1]|uniref:BrnA antitoxin family protein n=1 Tax=Arhodomonas sp. SL1 TaxID=3425691 RepID=UPI003F885A66
MRNEYDFSKGKRGPAVEPPGKTRITIMLDNDVIEAFRKRAEARGIGYQTAINEALRAALDDENMPLTAGRLREILRQELHHAN